MISYTFVGLPRSRTSWLSVFFTWGISFCVHEPMRFEKKKNIHIYPKYTKYFGISDSTLSLFPEEIPGHTKLVIIYREPLEVKKSLRKLGIFCDKIVDVCQIGLSGIALDREHLEVRFDDIDNRLEEIWEYCLPGLTFPHKRSKEMIRLNIQPGINIAQTMTEVTSERLEAIRQRLDGA